jgi:hypothetical protein
MFNITVGGTSNHNLMSDMMRSDTMSSETDARGDRVNMSTVQHTCKEEEEDVKCVQKFKTSLYICVQISIIMGQWCASFMWLWVDYSETLLLIKYTLVILLM